MREKRGISPVIATVIIVAIAITVAIAVGLWITGIVGTFTRFERIEITSAYVSNKTTTAFTISIIANNTGSADATITEIFINGVPIGSVGANQTNIKGVTVKSGQGISGTIVLPATTYKSGQTVEIVLHTASGKDYPKSVLLP